MSTLKKAQEVASNFAGSIAGALTFQKNLTDLVRGIRKNLADESVFISQCIQEIKQELKTEDKKVKMIAIQKLTYVREIILRSKFYIFKLQMKGYDMSWAAFSIIEVITNPKFTAKRIGYLAASQSFSEDTEVVMLITNMLRKVHYFIINIFFKNLGYAWI